MLASPRSLLLLLIAILSVGLVPTAAAQPGCDGEPYLPEHIVPVFGVPVSTTANPPAFWLGPDCYQTLGNTVGGIYIDDGTATVLYGVTDATSIWSIFTTPFAPTAIYDFQFAGTEIMFAGADIKCSPECPFALHVAFGISEQAAATAWFDDFLEFPLESPPSQVGLFSICVPAPPYSECFVSLNILTEGQVLHMIFGGVDHDDYMSPTPVRDAMTFTNSADGGVIIIREDYPNSFVDVVRPNINGPSIVTSTPITPLYDNYVVNPTGITVNPGQPDEQDVPIAINIEVVDMGFEQEGATYNFAPCYPSIIGENMGWDFAALVCPGQEIPGGPLVKAEQRDEIIPFRPRGEWMDFVSPAWGLADSVLVLGGQLGNGDFEVAGVADWEGWAAVDRSEGVYGSYAKIWPYLSDDDPEPGGFDNAVAFIDDGVVVPGSPGIVCTNWCYGPFGFVKNVYGGIGPVTGELDNEIVSPVLTLPPTYDELLVDFDAFLHEPLLSTEGRTLATVRVRSRPLGGTWTPWRSRGEGYYSGIPSTLRHRERLTVLLGEDAEEFQVALGVLEMHDHVGGAETETSPAPYFDNVRIIAAQRTGPALAALDADQAQDAFPADGTLNYIALGNNHVPFDRARSTGLPFETVINTPGDQVRVQIRPATGQQLTAPPRLYYRMKRNPLFDPYRLPAWPEAGYVEGTLAPALPGDVQTWEFGLPDPDLLYPGDVLHYYYEAMDPTGVSTLPADTTGFALFRGDPGFVAPVYPAKYTVRALPSMLSATPGDQPSILLWDDAGNADEANEWRTALLNLGYVEGVDFDVYTTKSASSGVGSGLGGWATLAHIEQYETIIYSSGDQARFTLGSLSNGQPSDDVGLLAAWLAEPGGNLIAVGDNLVWDLENSAGAAFPTAWLGVSLNSQDALTLAGGGTSAEVSPVAGNTVGIVTPFVAYAGGSPWQLFDAVNPEPGTEVLAAFGPAGSGGPPALTATTVGDSPVVYSPVSFRSWYSPSDWNAPMAARTMVLGEIFAWFGVAGGGPATEVPAASRGLQVSAAPNPFNPSVTIKWSRPNAEQLRVRIFDLRGAVVRTLVDGHERATEGSTVWRGDLEDGSAAPSGVYFYEVRSGQLVQSGKLMLLK